MYDNHRSEGSNLLSAMADKRSFIHVFFHQGVEICRRGML